MFGGENKAKLLMAMLGGADGLEMIIKGLEPKIQPIIEKWSSELDEGLEFGILITGASKGELKIVPVHELAIRLDKESKSIEIVEILKVSKLSTVITKLISNGGK
jgi:hypothetical protein